MPSDYDKIRADNIREYGEGTRHLSFLGRLYTDRTHFVFELLQNAEDAGASRILFRLFDDRLEVTHDGRPFNELDVRGVCGVGEGTKAEDLTQIGKFGIGFKSVYAYTSTPEVHSGDESFRIENYVRPYAVERRLIGDSWSTLFVFAFDADSFDPETACREIGARLRNLSARTLLFLRKIDEIEYKLPDLTGGVYLREEVERGPARQVTVIGQNNGLDEDENWLIFERPVPVPDCSNQVRVEVGFRLEISPKDKTESITRIKDAPLVVYFPTEKATRFGFLIQGPYRTTPSRDNIPKDDDWNEILVAETAILVNDTLRSLKDMGMLSVPLLEAMPIRMEEFPKGSMFYPIVDKVREALLKEELLPTDDQSFVSAANAKIARGGELRNLLNQDQLRLLFQVKSVTKWLSADITQDRTPDLRSYLMNELDVEEVTPDGFARKLSLPFLASQSDEWFIRFYMYLSGQESLWRSPRWGGDTGGVLRSKPILRLQDDSHKMLFRSDGTPNAFLPPPEDTDFPIVKREIVGNEKVGDFLKRLGLSEPDVFDDIVERVLPKYNRPDASSISQDEHSVDIQKILRAMSSDSEAGKKKVLRAARQTPFLMAIDQGGDVSFRKPGEVYADTTELRRYFSSAADVWFLNEPAVDLYSESDPWVQLGVAHLPRRVQFSDGLPVGEREYSTRGETIENFDLHGLVEFLESLQHISDVDKQKELSRLLWGYLEEHLEANPRFFKGRYQWFYYSSQSKLFDCLTLTRLQEAKWVPTKEDGIQRPVEIMDVQLLDECLGSNELIDILGIQRGSDDGNRSEEQTRHEHARELGVSLEDIELLRLHPEEFDQWKATISAQKQKPAFPERASSNPERRREKLEEQMGDAPKKEYEQRERSVRTTRGTIEPTLWLRNQYKNEDGQMVCQVCKEEMPFRKRDGEHYFETVEALSRDHFTMEHESQFLALCPLCAAMYNEFIKQDEEAMANMKNALMNSEGFEVPLRLGELDTSIRFVETHYHDIKTIIEASIQDNS